MNSARLPQVFSTGDSITIQYFPYLQTMLAGVVDLRTKGDMQDALKDLDVPTGANLGDSAMAVRFLSCLAKDETYRPDLLLVNCGLHDIKTDKQTGQRQVCADDYPKNLATILQLGQRIGRRFAFVLTTPVDDRQHNEVRPTSFYRYEKDVLACNRTAHEIFGAAGVPLLDLHTFTRNLGAGTYCDHVHFVEDVRARQAACVAGFILSQLQG